MHNKILKNFRTCN